jgi:hypothetical protein
MADVPSPEARDAWRSLAILHQHVNTKPLLQCCSCPTAATARRPTRLGRVNFPAHRRRPSASISEPRDHGRPRRHVPPVTRTRPRNANSARRAPDHRREGPHSPENNFTSPRESLLLTPAFSHSLPPPLLPFRSRKKRSATGRQPATAVIPHSPISGANGGGVVSHLPFGWLAPRRPGFPITGSAIQGR